MFPWEGAPTDLYSGRAKVIESYKKCCMRVGNAFFVERGIIFIGWWAGMVSPIR